MKTLFDKINAIIGRDCKAIGGVRGEAIEVIREMEERLERILQNLQIMDDWPYEREVQELLDEAMTLADSVAELPACEGEAV